jgi:hypothetical protein
MCLLLYKPADAELSEAELRDFYVHNPHGFGIMYLDQGRVVTHRLVGQFKKVKRLYREFAAGRECAIHFRMRTHGPISRANTHPFEITNTLYMMHNGILGGYGGKTAYPGESDTAHFSRELRAVMTTEAPNVHRRAGFAKAMGEIIGFSNRMIFLSPQEGYQIVNEEEGRWHQRCWYSNDYAWSSPYDAAYGYSWLPVRSVDPSEDAEHTFSEEYGSIWEIPMTADEETAVSDLISWAEARGSEDEALLALEAPDYAIDLISRGYTNPAEMADWLWFVLPQVRQEFSAVRPRSLLKIAA